VEVVADNTEAVDPEVAAHIAQIVGVADSRTSKSR